MSDSTIQKSAPEPPADTHSFNRSRRDAAISVVTGAIAAILVWFNYRFDPESWSDIDQIWLASRALVAAQNPYQVVRDAFPWPLYYPLPSVLVGLPLVPLSLMEARCAFAFLSGGVCAWAVLRRQRSIWPLLVAPPFIFAVIRGQWSPLVLAACLVPAWGILALTGKPSVGLGAFFYRPTRLVAIGAAALTLLSLILLPKWPFYWLEAIRIQPNLRSPLLLPGGVLLALVLLRWRRPEARLFAILAMVPQTVGLYELVPLAVVPRTRREVVLVLACWTAAYLIRLRRASLDVFANFPADYMPYRWWALLLFGYLPILLLILLRPNIAESPKSG